MSRSCRFLLFYHHSYNEVTLRGPLVTAGSAVHFAMLLNKAVSLLISICVEPLTTTIIKSPWFCDGIVPMAQSI